MKTFETLRADWMQDPAFKAEYDRIAREEMSMLDAILNTRKAANLTQMDVALRMGVKPPVVSRLENSLVTGKHSPSIQTLRRYAQAMGKSLEIRFV